MAIVPLNSANVDTIVATVQHKFNEKRSKITAKTSLPLEGMGEYIYKQIIGGDPVVMAANLPSWAHYERNSIRLKIMTDVDTGYERSYVLGFKDYLPSFKPAALGFVDTETGLAPIPGTSYAYYDGNTVGIRITDDGASLPDNPYKQFMLDQLANAKEHAAITKETQEVCTTMRAFLDRHRTLQSALKDFGPALLNYTPDWMQEELKRKPKVRTRKPLPPASAEPMDITKLVVNATIDKLNMD